MTTVNTLIVTMTAGSAFGWALCFGLIGASFAHYGPVFLAWTDRRKQGIRGPKDAPRGPGATQVWFTTHVWFEEPHSNEETGQ